MDWRCNTPKDEKKVRGRRAEWRLIRGRKSADLESRGSGKTLPKKIPKKKGGAERRTEVAQSAKPHASSAERNRRKTQASSEDEE